MLGKRLQKHGEIKRRQRMSQGLEVVEERALALLARKVELCCRAS